MVEMRFFTRVNVTDVKVRGTATRGEKIDYQSYKFEGKIPGGLAALSDYHLVSKVIKLLAAFLPSCLRWAETELQCSYFRRDGQTFTKQNRFPSWPHESYQHTETVL